MNPPDAIAAARDRYVVGTIRALHWCCIPALMAVHSVIWYGTGVSSAVAVYALKLVTLSVIAVVLLRYRIGPMLSRPLRPLLLGSTAVLLGSVIATAIHYDEVSLAYALSDAAGWLATTGYIVVLFYALRRGLLPVEDLFGALRWGTVIVCCGFIIAWAMTGGEKVSIPPDVHLGVALTLGRWLTARGTRRPVEHLLILVIVIGVVASAFRMNYVVTVFTILVSITWILVRDADLRRIGRVAIILCVVAATAIGFREQVRGRLESFALSSTVDIRSGEVLSDRSAGQRFVEGVLVIDEVIGSPVALIIGKGFGATFDNSAGLIPHLDDQVHNVHSTPLTVLLRSGGLGLVLLLAVPLIACRDLFTRDPDLFVAALGLLASYLALLTDQYLYWSLSFGTAFALWLHARQGLARRRAVHRPLIPATSQ